VADKIKCTEPGCDAEVPNHAWGKIKAAGWFFQKNDDAWCPNHRPEWYNEWRKKQKKKE